jgi:hypothetical protein
VRLSTAWCWPSARPSPPPSCNSCNLQPVKVAVGGCKAAGSRRRSATRPRVPQRSPYEPLRAWAVADRAVGRRVVPCEGPLRTQVTLRRCIPRRRAQADRCGRDAFPSRLRRAIPDNRHRRLNGESMHRRLGSPCLSHWGSYLPHSSGKAARPPPRSLQRPHDGRSASGGHL